MDLMDIGAALKKAEEYANSVALNGVPVKAPLINPSTKRWEIFNPLSNSYVDSGIFAEGQSGNDGITPHIDPASKHWFIGTNDTGIIAEGSADIQSISNIEIQNILDSL